MSLAPFLPWIDFLWFPVALVTMERGKRLLTCLFILGCVVLLRLQVELLAQIGFPRGVFGLLDSALLLRGLVTYGVFIALFLIIAHLSQGAHKAIHLAASITMMIASFCVSTLVMVL